MLGVKRLDGIVFKAFIGPLIFTFIISEFIFLMQFLWKYIDDLVGKGLEFGLVSQLLVLFSFKVLPLALPLSILLSSAMTMGNFGEHNELVACKSSGISTLRSMGSLIVFVAILSTGAYFFSNNVLPYTNMKFMTLLMDIRRHKPALDIKQGVFYKGISGYTMKIDNKSPNNTTIYGIVVYDHTSGYGNDNVIMAEKGEMQLSPDQQYMIFELFNGRQYQETRRRSRFGNDLNEQTVVEFDHYRKIFDLKEFKLNRSDGTLFKGHQEMLNSRQLRYEIDSMQRDVAKMPDVVDQYNRNFITYSKPKELFGTDTVDQHIIDSLQFQAVVMDQGPSYSVVQSALSNVESIKSYIEMNKADLEMKEYHIQRFEVEWHKKYLLSFACIILLLIGGSMGAIVRKGGLGMPILISVFFYMLFHILNMIGDKLAYNSVVSAFLGAWFPTLVLLPIAIWLTYAATNDATIMKKETYMNIFRWIRLLPHYLKLKKPRS